MSTSKEQPARCSQCGFLTIEEWVRRLNARGRDMDETAASMHPSAWHEALRPDREAYTKLAQASTCKCKGVNDGN